VQEKFVLKFIRFWTTGIMSSIFVVPAWSEVKAHENFKKMVWLQDDRGNYSFEIHKCWQKSKVGGFPTYSPSKDCPASEKGKWNLSLAYAGPFRKKAGQVKPKYVGIFDNGSAAVAGFSDIEVNGRYYDTGWLDETHKVRQWVLISDCNTQANGDVISTDQVDPTFTETRSKWPENSETVPEVFKRFAESTECQAPRDESGKHHGAGVIKSFNPTGTDPVESD
jgi:hypothetical protein